MSSFETNLMWTSYCSELHDLILINLDFTTSETVQLPLPRWKSENPKSRPFVLDSAAVDNPRLPTLASSTQSEPARTATLLDETWFRLGLEQTPTPWFQISAQIDRGASKDKGQIPDPLHLDSPPTSPTQRRVEVGVGSSVAAALMHPANHYREPREDQDM